MKFYTIKNVAVKEVVLNLAGHVLSLPTGAWAETTQAVEQLNDNLPDGLTVDDVLEFTARHTTEINSTRMGWLANLGRKYTAADAPKVYPALGGK